MKKMSPLKNFGIPLKTNELKWINIISLNRFWLRKFQYTVIHCSFEKYFDFYQKSSVTILL